MSSKLHGAADLKAAMKALGEYDQKAGKRITARAQRKAADLIADDMKRRVPIDFGDLHAAIKGRSRTRQGIPRGQVAVEGDPKTRWHFPEFGTRHHAAQPYARPAVDAKSDEAGAVVTNELWAGMERLAKRLRKNFGKSSR